MKKETHNFVEDIKIGERGELIAIRYYADSPDVTYIHDVRDDPNYRDKDIDFLIETDRFNRTVSTEVKADTTTGTGNIFVEEKSCIETNTDGCLVKTGATFVLYIFLQENVAYRIYTPKFQDWYEENKERFPIKNVANKRYDGSIYHCEGRPVPRAILETLDFVRKVHINCEHVTASDILNSPKFKGGKYPA